MADHHHVIKLRNGTLIYLPTSIPVALLPFVDTKHLIKNKNMTDFKKLLKEKV